MFLVFLVAILVIIGTGLPNGYYGPPLSFRLGADILAGIVIGMLIYEALETHSFAGYSIPENQIANSSDLRLAIALTFGFLGFVATLFVDCAMEAKTS